MSDKLVSLSITIGDENDVIIKFSNTSSLITAKALLIVGERSNPSRVLLDRAIHSPGAKGFCGWSVSGVVSDLRRTE